MSTLPNAALRWIPAAKIADYLLNPDHAWGGPKARFFMACGFRPERGEALTAALMDHAVSHPAREGDLTPYGRKFIVDGPLVTPGGRKVVIRAVWMVRDTGIPDLITAYPL